MNWLNHADAVAAVRKARVGRRCLGIIWSNPGLQRTRFALRRSPLSRKPFGAIKALLVSIVTCVLVLAPASADQGPLSNVQLDALAHEALDHTPEKVHFAKGTAFSWVVFTVNGTGLQLELSKRIWDLLKTRYHVYALEVDLPEGSARPCGEESKCYEGGFLFHVAATVRSQNTVEVTYSDFEAPLAASSQTIQYRWNGSRWRVVKKGPLIVS